MRKKPNLLARLAACGELVIAEPKAHRGHWRELLPGAREVHVELGCGKGRFTVGTAQADPGVLLVAVERVPDAMVIAAERARALDLHNVFFIDADAADLGEYFAPGEVARIYLNFSDPWPPARQAKRRLTHPDFLRVYRQVLCENGQIHFKTDNRDLFEWSLFQFPKAGFTLSEVTRDLHAGGVRGVMTDYEEKFHALGTPINRCVGTKQPLRSLPEALAARLTGWEVRAVTEDDLSALLELEKGNAAFFALSGCVPTMEALRRDLASLPPRCAPERKHVLALWRDGRPCAVLDVVEGYPRTGTAFIGLLMVRHELQRQGVGRETVEALAGAAGETGTGRLRLACLPNNAAGHAFWEAMGFRDLRMGKTLDEGQTPVWIMERLVKREDGGGEG